MSENKNKTDPVLQKIHTDSITEFKRVMSAVREERTKCLKDRRFYSIPGAQWEGPFAELFKDKPKLEVNKIHLDIIRIINEYRNNRITVDFVPTDGSKNDDLADTLDGLYRADEERSVADEATDNAFEEAVGGGMGAWRLRAGLVDEYDPENDEQDVFFDPIFDADSSVFFNLDATRQDKSDATKGWLIKPIPKQTYIKKYDDDPASWPKEKLEQWQFDWSTPDVVYVAEYYEVELKEQTLKIYKDVNGKEERYTEEDFENDPALEDKLVYAVTTFVRERKIKVKKVHKYLQSGNSILEDQGYIAGTEIPIVPMYGKRWIVDGIERCMGHGSLAKDLQRVINAQYTKLMEISALSTVEKPIVTPEQMAGHELMWSEDNVKNFPYLFMNAVTDKDGNELTVGPTSYTRVPNIPPALAALLQISEKDIKEILGNQENGEKIIPNMSGKAIELVQTALAMQVFIYMSNMAKAMKRSGEIWLSMKKDLMVENGRKAKIINKNGEPESIELRKAYKDSETGETRYKNDIGKAKHGVVAQVGPASSTKKAAIVRELTQMMQVTTDPETMQVLGAMTMMNMEGEGIDDVRGYFRKKLTKMGVIEPTKEESQKLIEEQQNQPPNAEEEFLLSAAKESEADAANKRASVIKTLNDAEYTKAKTAEILSNMEKGEYEEAIRISKEVEQTAQGQPSSLQIGRDL